MSKQPSYITEAGFGLLVRASFGFLVALFAAAPASMQAQATAPPAAAYGPFNAVFLADGPGLNKTLSPSTSLDGVWAVAMDGQGSGQPPMQDPVLAGRASWTLAFWFELPEPQQGTTLLAGIGDPAAEDARFVGMKDNRLGLWLGRAQSSAGFVAGDQALDSGKWHLAVATSDGEHAGSLCRWPRGGGERACARQRCGGFGDGAAAVGKCRRRAFWRQDRGAEDLSRGVDGRASEGDGRCAAGLWRANLRGGFATLACADTLAGRIQRAARSIHITAWQRRDTKGRCERAERSGLALQVGWRQSVEARWWLEAAGGAASESNRRRDFQDGLCRQGLAGGDSAGHRADDDDRSRHLSRS